MVSAGGDDPASVGRERRGQDRVFVARQHLTVLRAYVPVIQHVPELDLALLADGNDAPRVGREGARLNRPAMAPQQRAEPARFDFPHAHRIVIAPAEHILRVRRETQRPHGRRVPFERSALLLCKRCRRHQPFDLDFLDVVGLPHQHSVIGTAGSDVTAVGRNRGRKYRPLVAEERLGLGGAGGGPALIDRPDNHFAVLTRGHDLRFVGGENGRPHPPAMPL